MILSGISHGFPPGFCQGFPPGFSGFRIQDFRIQDSWVSIRGSFDASFRVCVILPGFSGELQGFSPGPCLLGFFLKSHPGYFLRTPQGLLSRFQQWFQSGFLLIFFLHRFLSRFLLRLFKILSEIFLGFFQWFPSRFLQACLPGFLQGFFMNFVRIFSRDFSRNAFKILWGIFFGIPPWNCIDFQFSYEC